MMILRDLYSDYTIDSLTTCFDVDSSALWEK